MTQRGDENSFQTLSKALNDVNNAFHIAKTLKHYQYAAKVDSLFENCPYGWSKSAFYAEAEQRAGLNRPTSQSSGESTSKKKKKPPVAK